MRHYECADCGERDATVFLPEGRYLCQPCWSALRTLRGYVIRGTAARGRAHAARREADARA